MNFVYPRENVLLSLDQPGFGIADFSGKLMPSVEVLTDNFFQARIFEANIGSRLVWLLTGEVASSGILKVVALNFETLVEVNDQLDHRDRIKLNTNPPIFVARK